LIDSAKTTCVAVRLTSQMVEHNGEEKDHSVQAEVIAGANRRRLSAP
jgi:hypothetical protein